MVVVSVGECAQPGAERKGGGKDGREVSAAPPSLVHYPVHKCPGKVDYPPGYDSDSGNSDHSSSGRGSGGSDLGSEADHR